jgi:hypothetical protein
MPIERECGFNFDVTVYPRDYARGNEEEELEPEGQGQEEQKGEKEDNEDNEDF